MNTDRSWSSTQTNHWWDYFWYCHLFGSMHYSNWIPWHCSMCRNHINEKVDFEDAWCLNLHRSNLVDSWPRSSGSTVISWSGWVYSGWVWAILHKCEGAKVWGPHEPLGGKWNNSIQNEKKITSANILFLVLSSSV